MAEKKENTKAMPEVVYTVEEYAENPQVLGVSEDIIRTAFAKAGIREAMFSTPDAFRTFDTSSIVLPVV